MNNTQSRPGASTLAFLVVAFGVSIGAVGCSSEHPTTTSGPSGTGESSSSAEARPLVDVEKVWQSEPLPDCPKPPIVFNGDAPQGLPLPGKASVAKQLAGAQSPAPEQWVRTKLGWITQELAATRADIIDANTPDDSSMQNGFEQYVMHVRDELQAGHDISDPIDKTYPEGCS